VKIVDNPYFGHIIVFVVVGSLIGYSPMFMGIIRKTRLATDSLLRFLTRASLLSLIIALVCVAIFDYYARFIPWSSIPVWFWYLVGVFFAGVAIKKYIRYLKSREMTTLYNAGWFALSGLLITMYETMFTSGTSGIILTLIILFLAVLVRYCYWKQLHHHAKEST
jgi:hypothetical protein